MRSAVLLALALPSAAFIGCTALQAAQDASLIETALCPDLAAVPDGAGGILAMACADIAGAIAADQAVKAAQQAAQAAGAKAAKVALTVLPCPRSAATVLRIGARVVGRSCTAAAHAIVAPVVARLGGVGDAGGDG